MTNLFKRFNRGSTEGAGLGLAICKSIVDAHAGAIDVQSRPGEGTSVTVTLPKE
jgi:signal transduction histidine kinase